jgi:hypothetical protein
VDVVEDWRHDGPAENGRVLVRLKLRRPRDNMPVDVHPTFARLFTVQISDDPVEYRSLDSAMDAIRDAVLGVVVGTTSLLGAPMPSPDEFEPARNTRRSPLNSAARWLGRAPSMARCIGCRCPSPDAETLEHPASAVDQRRPRVRANLEILCGHVAETIQRGDKSRSNS